jgi:hypothetical protein
MTPEEARARARAILEQQKVGKVVQLNSDGSLRTDHSIPQGKSTVLHDPKGEYA